MRCPEDGRWRENMGEGTRRWMPKQSWTPRFFSMCLILHGQTCQASCRTLLLFSAGTFRTVNHCSGVYTFQLTQACTQEAAHGMGTHVTGISVYAQRDTGNYYIVRRPCPGTPNRPIDTTSKCYRIGGYFQVPLQRLEQRAASRAAESRRGHRTSRAAWGPPCHL